jgi:MSHA biogenesis protein MshQ
MMPPNKPARLDDEQPAAQTEADRIGLPLARLVRARARRWPAWGILLATLLGVPHMVAANPIVDAQNGLSCAGVRYGGALTCTAGEFAAVVNITHVGDPNASCNEGEYFYLNGELDMQNSNATRYNVGFFTGENSNDPRATTGQCSVATFPTTPSPWFDADANACGDFVAQGQSTPVVQNLRVSCTGNAQGELTVPYVVSYQQNPQICSGPGDVTPGSPSKCNAGTAVVSNVVVVPRPAANYRFDEPDWSGSTGEVTDSSDNGLDGTAQNGASTAADLPAIPGDPGTCGYGDFDGNNDEVRIPHDSRLQGNDALTYTAWIRPQTWSGGIRQVMSKSVHGGGAGRAQMGIFSENGVLKGRAMTFNGDPTSGEEIQTSLPALDAWTHVALVFAGNQLTLYVNGAIAAQQIFSSTTLRTNNDPFTIGNDTGRSYYFSGFIDEARIYATALSTAQVIGVMNDTHPCTPVVSGCGPIPNTYPVYGGSDVDIDEDVTINNGTTTSTVEEGDNNGNAVQTDGNVVTASQTLPPIEPATFPGTGSTDLNLSGTQTINSAVQASFDDITLGNNSIVTFTGGGPFYIDRLQVGRNVTLTFEAGIYFIDDFIVNRDNVNIITNGTVRIYIRTEFNSSGGNNLTINNGGSAADFVMFLYPGAVFNADGKELNYTGVIYGPNSGDIEIEEDAVITGAIIGGGDIEIGEDTQLIYTPTVAAQVATVSTCFSTVSLSHYAISHPGNGVTCTSIPVTITAHDPSHTPVDPGNITITLSTSTNRGTWSGIVSGSGTLIDATPGDGVAAYTFPSGETSVELAFNYTNPLSIPETLSLNVTDGTATEQTGTALASEDPDLTFYDSGFIFNNDTDGNLSIPTQISGKDSNMNPGAKTITLQAVRADTNNPAVCLPAFQDQTLDIDFAAECRNPGTCSTGAVGDLVLNGTTLTATNDDDGTNGTTVYETRNVTFDANGKYALVLNYPDAGLVQLHARHNILLDDGSGTPSGNYMYGSSNDFVVRPFGFALTDIRAAGADTLYGTPDDILNPGGTASSGGGFVAAEEDFRASIQAVQYSAADDSNVDGIPDVGADLNDNGITPNFAWASQISVASSNFTPAVPMPGNISGGSTINQATFSNGGAATGDIYYDNVGSIQLLASADNYLGAVDADVFGQSGTVGRFYPHHFSLNASSVTPACGVFTYMGQPFTDISVNLQAEGALNGLTSFYDFAAGYTTGTIESLAEDLDHDGTPLSLRVTDLDTTGDSWSAGISNISSATVTFSRTISPDGIYSRLILGTRVIDTDGGSMQGANINPATTGDCTLTSTCTGIRLGSPTEYDVRYGRFVLQNAFGSELAPLAIPLRVEYYDEANAGFMLSNADSCTDYDGTTMNVLATSGLTPANLIFTGVGTSTSGLTDPLNPIQVTQAAPGEVGSADIELPVPAWLQYDWDNNGTDDDPTATITFGIYGGSESTIFVREVYE